MKKTLFALFTVLFLGCAEEALPEGDEPVAGSVAAVAAPLTATVTLTSVLNHFGISGVSFNAMPILNQVHYQVVLPKTLYWRVGDTATFPFKFGYHAGNVDTGGYDVLCKALSGRKLYVKINGAYAQGLNLEGKLVVNE